VTTPAQPSTDELTPVVYDELKRLARQQLRDRSGGSTLSPTELVHEAFFRLAQREGADWDGRAHFFGAAARAMRQVLVDFARRKRAAKRGGGWGQVTLRDGDATLELELDSLLELDAALDRLDSISQRLRQLVELRFFGGLPDHEIAGLLGVSQRTVERDWLKARLFLLHELDLGQPTKV
jgi:RNA polymerase sigma-70 factor, ECF subfamily